MIKALRYIVVLLLIILGGATVFMATSIIFDWFGIREMEGNYLPLIVYANLVCGLIYLYAAYSLIKKQKLAAWLLTFATGILVLASIAFAVYVYQGGIHEKQTVIALIFRTSITAFLAWLSFYIYKKAARAINS